jgi:prepilin-type N-terminal cleavage/methylation domain-containing protein
MTQKNKSGFTLVEFLIAVAMLAGVFLVVAAFIKPVSQYFLQSRARSELNSDARTTLDTITRSLRSGRAGSVSIQTETGAPPNSRIDFETNDGASVTVRWISPNQVEFSRQPRGGTRTTSVIARNVTGLLFTVDYRDPSVVGVTLRLDRPYDASGRADRLYSIVLPTQEVRLIGAQ